MALIIPGVAATESFAILPVMLGIVARGWWLTDEMLGILASAELAGLALGTLIAIKLMYSWGRKRTAFRAMLILTIANAATLAAPNILSLMAVRVLAGLGAGAGLAICYVNLSHTTHPERNFAVFTLLQLLLGGVGLFILPFLAESIGWGAPYVILGSLAFLGMLAARLSLVPNNDGPASERGAGISNFLPSFLGNQRGVLALSGVGFYFIGITAVWAYLDRIGSVRSTTSAEVATIVAASQIVAMAGATAASLLAGRLSLATSLVTGSLMTILGISALIFASGPTGFMLAVAVMSFAWNYVTAPQFAVVAALDTDGSLAGVLSTVTGVGAALGPAFGSRFVGNGFASLLVSGALLVFASYLLIRFACRPINNHSRQ